MSNPVLFDGQLVLLEMILGIDGVVILEVVANDGREVDFWVTTLFSSSLKRDKNGLVGSNFVDPASFEKTKLSTFF